MADILKLKKKAADFEAKKQNDKALATYREMIEVYERGEEDPIDIPLYNRVGDLLQKAGNLPEAVSIWERAVDHYAEGGFYNPAIALCNKILRQSPGRTVVYYKLGKISAEKGFKGDARQNFLEYASRMQKSGNLDEAFRALKEFADLVPDQDDVRLMLADQLVKADRKPEAIEQLQIAYAQCVRDGRSADADAVVDRMKAIDPTVEPKADEGGSASKGGGLVFLDIEPSSGPGRGSTRGATPAEVKRLSKAVAGLELLDTGGQPVVAPPPKPAARPSLTPPPAARPSVAPPAERPAAAAQPPMEDLIIEPTSVGEVAPPPRGSVPGLESTRISEPAPEIPMLEVEETAPPKRPSGQAQPPVAVDLPMIEMDQPPAPPSAADMQVLDEIVEEPPSLTDFGTFGNAPPVVSDGFDLLEIESSEGVHALPMEPTFGEPKSQPLIERAPESMLPPIETEAPSAEERVPPVPEEAPPARVTSTVLANSVDLLRVKVETEPTDWALRRQFAEALLDDGQREAGVAELEAALTGFEGSGDLDTAASVAEEIVRLAPTVIKYHQKRVEFAFRANDRMRLAEAYVELADALLRDGQGPKARVVYQRVLEIAPDDLRAQAALETIQPEPVAAPAPPRRSTTAMKKPAAASPPAAAAAKAAGAKKPKSDDEFVSLGDWLRDDDEPKNTRMVVEEKEPTGDEQADFADMLRKFKQGVSDNVDEEDHEAHYDLGVAYKEMGLLDEAISEFQKALRGASNRVRAIEALGQCFVEKGQLPVAATILQRALAEQGVTDESLVGVLYLLGTIAEELHLFPDAKKHYERVFTVDIQFRDIGARLNAVEKKLK